MTTRGALIEVSWYDCECEHPKPGYCDEYHRVYGMIPLSVLNEQSGAISQKRDDTGISRKCDDRNDEGGK